MSRYHAGTERLAVENWIRPYLPLSLLVGVVIPPVFSNVLAPRNPYLALRSRRQIFNKLLQCQEPTRLETMDFNEQVSLGAKKVEHIPFQ